MGICLNVSLITWVGFEPVYFEPAVHHITYHATGTSLLCRMIFFLENYDFRLKNFKNKVSKVGDRSRGRPEGSLFSCYYIKLEGWALLLSLDWSTLPLIRTLYRWLLSKEVSSTIFKVFGMTRPRIEPRSPEPLANTTLKANEPVSLITIMKENY